MTRIAFTHLRVHITLPFQNNSLHIMHKCKYTTFQKFGFLKKVTYTHQGYIYLIKNAAQTVILKSIILIKIKVFYFNLILKCNLFLWWQSWIFSSH